VLIFLASRFDRGGSQRGRQRQPRTVPVSRGRRPPSSVDPTSDRPQPRQPVGVIKRAAAGTHFLDVRFYCRNSDRIIAAVGHLTLHTCPMEARHETACVADRTDDARRSVPPIVGTAYLRHTTARRWSPESAPRCAHHGFTAGLTSEPQAPPRNSFVHC